jgi:hypothetical protein
VVFLYLNVKDVLVVMDDTITFGRRALLGAIAATGVTGTGIASQNNEALVQSRERTSFENFSGEETPTTVLEKYGEPYANTATTVTGFDTFNTNVSNTWFSAIFSVSTDDPFDGSTLARDFSINVEPFSIPDDSNAPRITTVDPYVKDNSKNVNFARLEFLVDTIVQNVENQLPIALPDLGGLANDSGTSVEKKYWRGVRNSAFDVTWNSSMTNSETAVAVDFELDFPRAGNDGGAVGGTYAYDVEFKTTIQNGSINPTTETITQRHKIFFDIEGGENDGGGGGGCAPGDVCIS